MTNEELIALAKTGDEEALNQLFKQNQKLLHHFAKRYRKRHIEYDDLVSIAAIALFDAYKRFDPSRGLKFTTLAGYIIPNAISKSLRIPQKHRGHAESFEDVIFTAKDGSHITAEEMIGEEDSSFEKFENGELMQQVMQEFNRIATDRQKEVLRLRIENEMNQDDAGKIIGISQVQVSRIEKKIYSKLRKIAAKHGLEGSFVKGEMKEMDQFEVSSFIYLVKNYPELTCGDIGRILGVHHGKIAQYLRYYNKGKYDDILPEPGDLDERVAAYAREQHPEQLAGPVTITQLPKLEEDVEVKLKDVEKHQEWDSIKDHYEAQQELSERLKIPEETLKETKKIISEALNQPHPMVGMFPGKFEQLGQDIGKLVDKKNAAYGDSFAKTGDFLRLLYPNGIKPEQYMDALSIVRVWDKLKRIATDKDAFGENPWSDVAGYSLLGVANSGR